MTGVQVALAVSALGNAWGVSVVLALAMLALRRRNAAIVALGVPVVAFLSDALLKLLVHRPRPPGALIPEPQSFSFPSGHATVAAATYLTIGLLLADRLSGKMAKASCVGVCAVIAIAIGASRVYLGVHYLSDVLGGLVLGTAWAFVGRRLYVTRLRPMRRPES
jgi:undecaprenyl-diphosphatase